MLQQRTLCLMVISWLCLTQAQDDSENELSVSATLTLQRPSCQKDSDCSLTSACVSNSCTDPCQSDPTPCPMEGGQCKVVGHRPVCSCPAGTQNINNTCTTDTSCSRNGEKYNNGHHYYDESCEQKCECYLGEFICQQTSCEPGLRPKGLLSRETDPLCMERQHPGGDECCVLWVCAEEAEGRVNDVCENIICGAHAVCDSSKGTCLCTAGFAGDPNDLESGCQPPQEDAKTNIKLLQITSTSIQVQFPDITGGNLMYVESRLFGRKDPPWENAILVEGNEIFTLTGLKPGTSYTLRWKAPDRQYPDIEVSTSPFDVQKPKVIMTNRSHDSVMLSFDQFRPPGYTNGYVASWKEEEDGSWKTAEKEPTGDTPSIIIDGLRPNTDYVAKISIYDDYTNRVLGKSTEEIKFKTQPGCEYNSSSYAVGTFFVGCDSACECDEQGEVTCSERCQAPLHRRGVFADDILCVERPVDESNCCVLVHCAGTAQDNDSPCQDTECGPNAECKHEILREEKTETICVCKEGYTGDPDSEEGCSLASMLPEPASLALACLAQNKSYAPGQEWYDGCEYKCSCSPKLEILCESRCKIITENVDSRCELKPDPSDSCCKTMVCPSVSNNTNILQPSLPFDGCVFKNNTYQQGQRFYDGCDQQCQCMGFGDLVCLARCPPTKPGLGEDCYTLPDITDNCCNVTVCDKPKEFVPDVEKIHDSLTNSTEVAVLSKLKDITTEVTTAEDSQSTEGPQTTEDSQTTVDDVTEVTETTEKDVQLNKVLLEKTPRMNDLPSDESEGVYIGKFVKRHHGVQGALYAFNASTLIVKDFTYDGEGPDVFFWAGSTANPGSEGTILPYPFTGKFYQYEDTDAPVLGKFENQTIVLHIPPQLKISELRWLSIWCREFSINFGDIIWPRNIEFKFEKIADIEQVALDIESEEIEEITSCKVEGKMYAFGEEFHDGCTKYCICQDNGRVLCNDIECPHEFGLDVINPNCIEWEKFDDFVATPPACCPPVPTCKSDGSCHYQGKNFTNYDSIPEELSGCEQRCHCEDGEVMCRNACYDISDKPPSWLSCEANRAIQMPNPERLCCKIWGCSEVPVLDIPDRLIGSNAAPLNESCIAITFEIPPSIAGQKGYYEIHYSSGIGGHPDASRWPLQKITPEGGYIPDQGLIFGDPEEGQAVLCSLLPNLEYYLRPSIVLDDYGNDPIIGEIVNSKIPISILSTPRPEPEVQYLDLKLQAPDSNIGTNSAKIIWRHFDEVEEKPYIDGVQLRYLVLKGDIPVSYVPETSPFIHRDTNYYVFENLEPNTKYEVEVDLIPVPNSQKELYSGKKVIFTTKEHVDIYHFKPELNLINVTSDSVEVGWTGVPSPDQKFVNIYRVIYHSLNPNSIRDESSVFKISKIDSPKRIRVASLQPDLEYQIWLEAYLTNGKTKKSNVVEFHTLPDRPSALPDTQRIESEKSGDNYYSSMVAAAIVAAFAILGLLVVLYFYLRRHTTYKATITKERPPSTSSAYDNQGFKGYETDANVNHTTTQSFEMGQLPGLNGTGENGVGKQNP